MIDTTPKPSTLHLPRMLCLHGGGVNAKIFHAQLRAIMPKLEPYFRLIFVEGPYPYASPGPDVEMIYEGFGGWRGWLFSTDPNGREPEPSATWREVDGAIGAAMAEDDARGATGEWVAALGFSQGGKIATSLLLRQQEAPELCPNTSYRFSVSMAGRGPLLPPHGQFAEYDTAVKVRKPTIHVHGLADPGLQWHRKMYKECCEDGTKKLIEWAGDHRLPFKPNDVGPVIEAIMTVARAEGLIKQ